jgi:hypothetical protein
MATGTTRKQIQTNTTISFRPDIIFLINRNFAGGGYVTIDGLVIAAGWIETDMVEESMVTVVR